MMSVIFLILTCTTSLTLHKTMNMTVYNRYSDMELASPVYFYNCVTYYEYPVEETNSGTIMRLGFRFDPDQNESNGILMYEVQENARFNHPSSVDTEAIEDESKMIRLLVIWKMRHSGRPKVRIVLVEHDNKLVLDEDKLAQLYDKMDDIPRNYDRSTWFIYDHRVLAITYKIVKKEDPELKITISKGIDDKYTMKPIWIDSERQVSSLLVIYIHSFT
jgi:hypothetical protein